MFIHGPNDPSERIDLDEWEILKTFTISNNDGIIAKTTYLKHKTSDRYAISERYTDGSVIDMFRNDLENKLEAALSREDYEAAKIIQDELNEYNKEHPKTKS